MITLYDDARAAAVNTLADALAGRSEPYAAGATVSGEVVDTNPHLAVTADGVTSRVRGVVQRVTVRVTAWHDTDIEASALAQLALALLDDAGYVPLTGPFDAVDPDSGRPFAAITVRASMQGRLAP